MLHAHTSFNDTSGDSARRRAFDMAHSIFPV
jgi:hypothetical protein